jgi:hypothetical protein
MSTSTATVKVLIILESPKDWDEWFEVVRNSAQARRILHLIDPELAVQPAQPVRPNEPQYIDVNSTFDLDNQTYANLTDSQKDHYKVLMSEYRIRSDQFEKKQRALIEIVELIQNTTARNLRPYIRGLDTPYDILKALKKRLAPTDRVRRLELVKEYNSLKKLSRIQNIEK